ncbi:PDC sensor domain-containing protein [Blastococcus mobilis]|uniref:Uncharacterized protein n=1 Tax=Blastococcus mobilis TaxID=1938746 RepID=A0A239ASS2_9ACTN|nr:PDC sensor domain-containing protein [Blastococcus mobilis]SNR98600.1 hypothetical protein SAMN06272737_1565 [Blastococcus mobilis]
MKDLGHWARFGARVLFAAVSLAVGVVNILVEKDVLPLSDGRQLAFVIVLASIALIDNVRHAVRRFFEPQKEQAQIRVQKPIIGVLLALAQTKNLQVKHLGSSIFVLRRTGLLRRRKLVRVIRFRLANHPQATQVEWGKGKGAVGTCWETGRAEYRYRRPVAEKYGARNLTDAEFAELQKKKGVTSGFSRTEFMSMVCKYAEILAVPIRSPEGELKGVVSIDLSIEAPGHARYLGDSKVERLVVEGAVHLLRDDLDRL